MRRDFGVAADRAGALVLVLGPVARRDHAEAGDVVAAHGVAIGEERHAHALPRQPRREAVGLRLVAFDLQRLLRERRHRPIAAQQRHGAAHRFQIVAATARRAGVDPQMRIAPAQFVPEREVALHVEILRDALAVGRVVLSPCGAVVAAVQVLAIPVESLRFHHAVDVLDEPLERGGIAEVEHVTRRCCRAGAIRDDSCRATSSDRPRAPARTTAGTACRSRAPCR